MKFPHPCSRGRSYAMSAFPIIVHPCSETSAPWILHITQLSNAQDSSKEHSCQHLLPQRKEALDSEVDSGLPGVSVWPYVVPQVAMFPWDHCSLVSELFMGFPIKSLKVQCAGTFSSNVLNCLPLKWATWEFLWNWIWPLAWHPGLKAVEVEVF